MSTEAFSTHKQRGFSKRSVLTVGPARSGGCSGADWLRSICSSCFIWSGTNAVYATTGSTGATFRTSEYLRRQLPTVPAQESIQP